MQQFAKLVFVLAVMIVATGLVGPPLALLSGILFSFFLPHPFEPQSARWSKSLLQASVVCLGFGLNFAEIVRTGEASLGYTAIGIALTMSAGLLLGKLLQVRSKTALLISAGTAICGGSAIAAIAPITQPDDDELAISMGAIFTLNSLALFLFPLVGFFLHLTELQFGLWSALAIHDTSSVIGAAARFGPQALAIGTVVKLTRSLWIIPLAMLLAASSKSRTRIRFPWFILLFCLAAGIRTLLPSEAFAYGALVGFGRIGLALTLFLIGTGLSFRTIRQAGVRVFLQSVLLWVAVAGVTLACVRAGWIHV